MSPAIALTRDELLSLSARGLVVMPRIVEREEDDREFRNRRQRERYHQNIDAERERARKKFKARYWSDPEAARQRSKGWYYARKERDSGD